MDELATAFQVTPQTIRRDVNWFADMDLLRRFHGGVTMPSSTENVAYSAPKQICHDEKRRIASLVACGRGTRASSGRWRSTSSANFASISQ